MKLYVEGGGETNILRTECRRGFNEFLKKAGFGGSMPRIVACGSRQNAYDAFCTALEKGESAILLVDSESKVDASHQQGQPVNWQPWLHLRNRQGDQWKKPESAEETDCHMMVQCMESWFLADRKTLKAFFGQGFDANALPPDGSPLESIAKSNVYRSLANATKNCKTKAKYGKGEHSFRILALIDSQLVFNSSPWAMRFLDETKKKMNI